MYPFTLANQYCVASNHNSTKNMVCYEKDCPKRGLICEWCQIEEHKDHKVISLEQYMNQISLVFTSSTNQEKLLNSIEAYQLNVNSEIRQMIENIYSLKNQIEKYLQQMTTFQLDFSLLLDSIKEMYHRVCSQSNQIRTKIDEKLPPSYVNKYVEDTLQLFEYDRTLECQIRNLDYNHQYKLECKQIVKDAKLFQKYENVHSYSKILRKKIVKIDQKMQYRFEQYFSDMNTHFNFYKLKAQKNQEQSQEMVVEDYGLELYHYKNPKLLNEMKMFCSYKPENDKFQDIVNLLQNKPKSIKIISKATQQKIATIRDISSSNGSSLFATITDAGMQIWDYKSGQKVRNIPGIKYGIFIQKYRYLACCENSIIKIINMQNYRVMKILKSNNSHIIRLYYDETNDILYSTGNIGKVELWNIMKGELIYCIMEARSQIYSITCTEIQKKQYLYYGEKEGSITIYDLKEKQVTKTKKMNDQVFFLKALEIQNKQILVAVASQKVFILDANTLEEYKKQEFVDFINSAMIVYDTLFITVGHEGMVLLMKISFDQKFPIVESRLKYSTERFALCWIEKSRVMIYNSKTIKQRTNILQQNNIVNHDNQNNNNNNNNINQMNNNFIFQNNFNNFDFHNPFNNTFHQGFHFNFNQTLQFLNDPSQGDDLIVCQY
ncbi:hypothetical protein TTHERM_00575600 (macronuclear) [Tetrahymena thermophila SB210]|uniref:Uncharacterized protein n=1 Tax=Tetrahymena thermophila (strain SB210) TaxID=312017 RepID=Q22V40_TETTS|nr:hypothetical protein TTHERM_00575600 [Tetrahymena thermophila SB210]EAR89108.2 hypothetical protein TTHERM_00575600 [Tetrahymena thermophila SB210]|eukprot:XP_001009353.2 hypothetical protein TTHERM_00575600 [Tetrahymena thermophila SB210]